MGYWKMYFCLSKREMLTPFYGIFRFKGLAVPAEDKEKVDDLQKMTLKRKAQLHEIEQSLPAKSGRYLQVSPPFQSPKSLI